ncbi:MAG: hypothetical protein H7Y03_00965 [Chitinophagaceae bacterium]|nr:hypothetical protein [Chitinophagaceae bacterium]
MAISTNPLFLALSGTLGDMLTIKNYKDKVVVCSKIGEREKKATPAQENNEDTFRAANVWAKKIYDDPIKREEARLRLDVPHGSPLYRAIFRECRQNIK